MLTILLSDQIIPCTKIFLKEIKDINFKDVISLFFHALIELAETDSEWKNIYDEFQTEFEMQNKNGWPELSLVRNDSQKRYDIFSSTSYIPTKNILLLLLRLLYIENYKLTNAYQFYDYHKILDAYIDLTVTNIQNITFGEIFSKIEECMRLYVRIYRGNGVENSLGKAILEQLVN